MRGTPFRGGQGVNPVRDSVNTSDFEPFKASGGCQEGVSGVSVGNGGEIETDPRPGPLSLILAARGRAQAPKWRTRNCQSVDST